MINRSTAREKKTNTGQLVQHLHELVTSGPGNLDLACAMSAYGYDAVKWAEGQGLLAELVSCDLPPQTTLRTAGQWYDEAAAAARRALAAHPNLLAKLSLSEANLK
jgi:hypothetical protein